MPVNSYIIWKASNSENKLLRRDFVKELGISLVKPYIEERKFESRNFSRDLFDQFFGEKTETVRPIVAWM